MASERLCGGVSLFLGCRNSLRFQRRLPRDQQQIVDGVTGEKKISFRYLDVYLLKSVQMVKNNTKLVSCCALTFFTDINIFKNKINAC